jgi:hypothetical protein
MVWAQVLPADRESGQSLPAWASLKFFASSSPSLRLPRALVRAMLSGKYLKKRYLLPLKDLTHTHIHGLSEKRAHAPRVSLLTKIAN